MVLLILAVRFNRNILTTVMQTVQDFKRQTSQRGNYAYSQNPILTYFVLD